MLDPSSLAGVGDRLALRQLDFCRSAFPVVGDNEDAVGTFDRTPDRFGR